MALFTSQVTVCPFLLALTFREAQRVELTFTLVVGDFFMRYFLLRWWNVVKRKMKFSEKYIGEYLRV